MYNQIELPVALNQQHGTTQRMGQAFGSAHQRMQETTKAAISQPQVAEAITSTPKPSTKDEVVGKMAANNALTVPAGVARETSSLLALLIKKGADPVQAALVMKSINAADYSLCKDKLNNVGAQLKKPVAIVRNDGQVKTQLGRLKELVFRSMLQPSPDTDFQIAQISANVFERAARISPELDELGGGEIVPCMVKAARLEGEMEYDSLFGTNARLAIATGEIDAEEATALVESGEILEQAADAGVAGSETPSPSDKKALGFLSKVPSVHPVLLLGLAGLGIYLYTRRK
jgi:hypothetical protein